MEPLTERIPIFASIFCALPFSAIILCVSLEAGYIFVERKVTHVIYLLRRYVCLIALWYFLNIYKAHYKH